ncbi:MAG TPA: single-stranded DNA-binding protein [Ginsengibacter sp.]|nr:single-stranded DNA-binding protein [Ginsengibacter sp.]
MIKLQIVGNLGKDCIVKEVNGKNVINFSVAHTERFKDSTGAPRERTTWVECAYWTDRTAVAPYLKKGQLVFAEGSPEAEGYMNKENQAAATLRMRVREIQLLGGRADGSPGNTSSPSMAGSASTSSFSSSGSVYNSNSGSPAAAQMEEAADDLPF